MTKSSPKGRQQKRSKFSLGKFIPKIPNFGTLLFGVLIGIFASCLTLFMFATSDIKLKIPALRLAKAKTVIEAPHVVVAAAAPERETRFDFYTELTKNEPAPTPVLDLKSTPKTIHGYLIQAGSFRRVADADALKAKLTLNGYAAKIEATKHRDGEVWQRVMIGTFKTEQHAKALQQQLKTLEIESTLVLKTD